MNSGTEIIFSVLFHSTGTKIVGERFDHLKQLKQLKQPNPKEHLSVEYFACYIPAVCLAFESQGKHFYKRYALTSLIPAPLVSLLLSPHSSLLQMCFRN